MVEADEDLLAAQLAQRGMVRLLGRYESPSLAWQVAMPVAARARGLDPWCADLPELGVVGEFTLPPPGVVQREFQALHIDFGLPRGGSREVPVARFTALHRAVDTAGSGAATRMVPLAGLLGQRAWPARDDLIDRLRGSTADDDPVEGVLARIVETADQSTDLPAKDSDGFLCGMEFATIEDERRYFAGHGMCLEKSEQEVVLDRGEMVIFDNLSFAHGRRGRRDTNELHQLCIGFRSLNPAGQATVLERVVSNFGGCSTLRPSRALGFV